MRSTASGLPLGPSREFSSRDLVISYGVFSDSGPLEDREHHLITVCLVIVLMTTDTTNCSQICLHVHLPEGGMGEAAVQVSLGVPATQLDSPRV